VPAARRPPPAARRHARSLPDRGAARVVELSRSCDGERLSSWFWVQRWRAGTVAVCPCVVIIIFLLLS